MINDKIIQRAVAKSIVWDTGDLIKLIAKYEPIDKNVSYGVLLSTVQNLLETNTDFANEFTTFLLKKKRLSDFNNTVKNAAGAIIVASLSKLTDTIIGSVTAKKERAHETEMVASQNTQQIMNMMMQEEQSRQNKDKQDNMLIIAAVVGMIAITGLIIYTKK